MLADFAVFLRSTFPSDVICFLETNDHLVFYGDRSLTSRRLINSLNDDHIPVTLHAIRLYRAIILNRCGEGVDLRGEFIHHTELASDWLFPRLHNQLPLFFKGEGR